MGGFGSMCGHHQDTRLMDTILKLKSKVINPDVLVG